jgi:hypothetical protein
MQTDHNLDSQLQNIQSQLWWQGAWRAQQHHQTNRLLKHNSALQQQHNALLQQQNELLEQIRRNQLTPAQRAAEDALRARKAMLLAAEAQLAAEKRKKQDLIACIACAVGLGLIVLFWAFSIHNGPTSSQTTSVQPTETPVQPTETPAPHAELVQLPTSQNDNR